MTATRTSSRRRTSAPDAAAPPARDRDGGPDGAGPEGPGAAPGPLAPAAAISPAGASIAGRGNPGPARTGRSARTGARPQTGSPARPGTDAPAAGIVADTAAAAERAATRPAPGSRPGKSEPAKAQPEKARRTPSRHPEPDPARPPPSEASVVATRPVTTLAVERDGDPAGPAIVSSAHLAQGALPSLSELEFGLNMLAHAYGRWMVRCMAAAGVSDLSPLDVQVLHHVVHRDRPKTIADLCLVLDVEDTHLVTYAAKKLQRLGLVAAGRRGKEKTLDASAEGRAACARYRTVREALLSGAVAATGLPPRRLSEVARLLRTLSGHYDQAARAAASL